MGTAFTRPINNYFMFFSTPAQFRAYAQARLEARQSHLDPLEAAKYARAVARLPLPVVDMVRDSVADILDALELPAVPEVTEADSAAIVEDLAAAA
jgi:hypothetical protein